MVPVKSVREYDIQLDVAVMFSETLGRALKMGYISQAQIDDCDPTIMITLPRLAIIGGLLLFADGPLNLERKRDDLPDMFSKFKTLLTKIRDLLNVLTKEELESLERSLCSQEESSLLPDVTLFADYTSGSSPGTPPDVTSVSNDCPKTERLPPEDPAETAAKLAGLSEKALKLRQKFRSSRDLIHRLFVGISGVADQLQTNFPSDMRAVLRMLFYPQDDQIDVLEVKGNTAAADSGTRGDVGEEAVEPESSPGESRRAPGVPWVPDEESPEYTACSAPFTLIRRRHHCRNCGKIFCARCSTNCLSLPDIGYDKAVRVCNHCFLFKLNAFTQPFTAQPPLSPDGPHSSRVERGI